MRNHDRFEELAALAAGGQIFGRELEQFLEHSEYCTHCREIFLSFVQLQEQDLPLLTKRSFERHQSEQVPDGVTERFLVKAQEAGANFSSNNAQIGSVWRSSYWNWFGVPRLAGGVAALLLLLTIGVTVGRYYESKPEQHSSAPKAILAAPTQDSSALLARIQELEHENQEKNAELARLQHERTSNSTTVTSLESRLKDASSESQSRQTAWDRHLAEEQVSIQQRDQQVSALRAELDKALENSAHDNAEIAGLETRLHEVTEQLKVQQAGLDRERELLSANRDIRDLMGARNLHIVDVIDADASGKKTKAFGRVFYTEGKSLIFYAYDLSESKLKNASYAFNVWGKKQSGSVQNLGILFQDDQHLRRWVLKVNDPIALQSISSVFVTVGPTEGARKPEGQKLLFAFVNMEPNHP